MRIFSPLSIEKMTEPQTPPNKMVLRGLGGTSTRLSLPTAASCLTWARSGTLDTPERPSGSIPSTKTYVVVLTNRVHPNNKGEVAGRAHPGLPTWWRRRWGRCREQQILDSRRALTSYAELMAGYRVLGLRNGT